MLMGRSTNCYYELVMLLHLYLMIIIIASGSGRLSRVLSGCNSS